MADRLRIVVIGLPELGYLLEGANPHGADVVTVPRGADVGAVLADKARGATRETLLFVAADSGDPEVNRLPDTLARAGFRGVVLAGLPGASGTIASHENLQVLSAPFSANDVLAALSALPGDVPFFLPVAEGDRTFGELAPVLDARPAVAAGGRRARNGVLFPRREAAGADDDPLGPPVRVLPLPPLPSPPPSSRRAAVALADAPDPASIPPPPRLIPPAPVVLPPPVTLAPAPTPDAPAEPAPALAPIEPDVAPRDLVPPEPASAAVEPDVVPMDRVVPAAKPSLAPMEPDVPPVDPEPAPSSKAKPVLAPVERDVAPADGAVPEDPALAVDRVAPAEAAASPAQPVMAPIEPEVAPLDRAVPAESSTPAEQAEDEGGEHADGGNEELESASDLGWTPPGGMPAIFATPPGAYVEMGEPAAPDTATEDEEPPPPQLVEPEDDDGGGVQGWARPPEPDGDDHDDGGGVQGWARPPEPGDPVESDDGDGDEVQGWARPPEPGDPVEPDDGDGVGVPGWARLPAAEPVAPPRAGAWAGTTPGPGALWVATPRLPAYDDEPVMPGARLPAPEPPRPERRGQVISVCSYKGGSGKCLTGDSLITDPVSGVSRRLDEVIREPEATTVLTLDGTSVKATAIADKIDSGVQPTVRVEFASGRSVTVTPHHPFLLADGWRPAAEITVGEKAALPARIPFPTEPRELSQTELAKLVTSLSDQDDRRLGVGPDVEPETAYRLDRSQLGQVLALLWAADGAVGLDGTPSLELHEEPNVRMVQHLLLRFGVQSRLTPLQGTAGWRLTIGKGDRATFAKSVPLCGQQFERLAPRIATDPKPGHEGDVAWDRVVAIRPAGRQQVWDLTVEPTHCFVANDIVVHNTTTAVLAAATLARAVRPGGKRVALVDANTAQSSVATILQRPARGSILDLVRTEVDDELLALALTPVPEAGELDVLFGAPDLRCTDERLLPPALWRRVVAGLRRTHDYVIVDTPVAEAVGHELFDDFVLRDSSVLLVVLDPNRETIHNNVEWLDIIGDPVSAGGRNFPPDRVAIVLNRADPSLTWNVDSVGDHFRRYHFLGAIPHSAAVQQAADDARLVQRFDSTVDQAVRHMLAALVNEPLLEADGAARTGGSALDRLLERLFGRRGARAECSPA